MHNIKLTRHAFAGLSAVAGALAAGYSPLLPATARRASRRVLTEFAYGDVSIDSAPHHAQLQNTQDELMSLSEDLPSAAVDRELEWRAGKDQSYR